MSQYIFTLDELQDNTSSAVKSIFEKMCADKYVILDFLVKIPVNQRSFAIEYHSYHNCIDVITGIKLPRKCNVEVIIKARDGEWDMTCSHEVRTFTNRLNPINVRYTISNTDHIVFIDPLPICAIPYMQSILFTFDQDITEVFAECKMLDGRNRENIMKRAPRDYSFLPGQDRLMINGGDLLVIKR